jgi:hypothetical protein
VNFWDWTLEVHLGTAGTQAIYQKLVDKRSHLFVTRTGCQLADNFAQTFNSYRQEEDNPFLWLSQAAGSN